MEVLWEGRRGREGEGDVELRACPFGNIPLVATQCGGTRGQAQGFTTLPPTGLPQPNSLGAHSRKVSGWRQPLHVVQLLQSSQCPIHSRPGVASSVLARAVGLSVVKRPPCSEAPSRIDHSLATRRPCTTHPHSLYLPYLLRHQIRISLLQSPLRDLSTAFESHRASLLP